MLQSSYPYEKRSNTLKMISNLLYFLNFILVNCYTSKLWTFYFRSSALFGFYFFIFVLFGFYFYSLLNVFVKYRNFNGKLGISDITLEFITVAFLGILSVNKTLFDR